MGKLEQVLSGAAYGGGTIAAWMMENLQGLIIGLGGLAIQFYFLWRKDKRERGKK